MFLFLFLILFAGAQRCQNVGRNFVRYSLAVLIKRKLKFWHFKINLGIFAYKNAREKSKMRERKVKMRERKVK